MYSPFFDPATEAALAASLVLTALKNFCTNRVS
ncbi:hypothetical protein J2777_002403 [Paraburkholderia graminis]|nr:hypothetical protein [Paraburkholderia graminis]